MFTYNIIQANNLWYTAKTAGLFTFKFAYQSCNSGSSVAYDNCSHVEGFRKPAYHQFTQVNVTNGNN